MLVSIPSGGLVAIMEDDRHSQNNKKSGGGEAAAVESGDLKKKIKETYCSKLLCPYSLYLRQEEARRDRQQQLLQVRLNIRVTYKAA